ncbi:MAG: DUF6166 domain-containing protein [Solirubrobacteraceae bacterium]
MFGAPPSLARPRRPRRSRRSERCYVGRRPGATEVYVVSGAGVEQLVHLGYRSTAAFDWGRSTPGALELAFSLLTHATRRQPTQLACRAFCGEVVACLDHAGFVLCDGDLALWLMGALSSAETADRDSQGDHHARQGWCAPPWLRSRLRRARSRLRRA